MAQKGYCLTFHYDDLGAGWLKLHQDSLTVAEVPACTGFVRYGNLLKGLPVGRWYIIAPSVDTQEKGMVVTGYGWKIRLYRWCMTKQEYVFTHYLIHPDGGNMPGTEGCIGVDGPRKDFRALLDRIINQKTQECIPVYVNVPKPIDGYDDRHADSVLASGIQL